VQIVGRYWLVYDILPAAALSEQAWLSLHFSYEAAFERQSPHAIFASVGNAGLLVSASAEHSEMQVLEASRSPVAGWVSPRYGELSRAFVCRVVTTGGPAIAATLLQPVSNSSEATQVEVKQADSGALGIKVSRVGQVDVLLLSRNSGERRANLFGIDFEGTALWLRAEDARPTELRGLAISRAESDPLGLSVKGRRGPCDVRLAFGQGSDAPRRESAADVEVVMR
jgi:hypothetical protein